MGPLVSCATRVFFFVMTLVDGALRRLSRAALIAGNPRAGSVLVAPMTLSADAVRALRVELVRMWRIERYDDAHDTGLVLPVAQLRMPPRAA